LRFGCPDVGILFCGWDAVADGAVLQVLQVLQERGLALVHDGSAFVGVQPGVEPAAERGRYVLKP